MDDRQLTDQLTTAGQAHLVAHAAELAQAQREQFLGELRSVDWELLARLASHLEDSPAVAHDDPRAQARRAHPPAPLVRQPQTPAMLSAWAAARDRGEAWLREGKVAAVLVAGGQGTRLGTTQPKGMFPIGPLSGKSLYQLFCEQLVARRRRYGAAIPYCIMTSDATHAETVAFFEQHHQFGLPAEDVFFFCQGNMPALDAATGRALLAAPGRLALSPDGHGGLLAALARSGVLQELARRGVETLFYHQVDNPTTILCDPALIGWHLEYLADVSTKVAAKRFAAEKMGVAVSVDGVTRIIEYSDLPPELAAETDAAGQLRIWAGNTAMHVFQRPFLERALVDERALPFHVARKVVPYWTAETGVVTPSEPNAYKFERFIFDILPWAQRSLIVEGDRAAEFNPVKNKDGADSPATAAAALQALHRSWLRRAGAQIGDDVPVEISPLVAVEADDLRGRVAPGAQFAAPLNWQADA